MSDVKEISIEDEMAENNKKIGAELEAQRKAAIAKKNAGQSAPSQESKQKEQDAKPDAKKE